MSDCDREVSLMKRPLAHWGLLHHEKKIILSIIPVILLLYPLEMAVKANEGGPLDAFTNLKKQLIAWLCLSVCPLRPSFFPHGIVRFPLERFWLNLIFEYFPTLRGNRGSTVVKVLCYKSEGRWFDPS